MGQLNGPVVLHTYRQHLLRPEQGRGRRVIPIERNAALSDDMLVDGDCGRQAHRKQDTVIRRAPHVLWGRDRKGLGWHRLIRRFWLRLNFSSSTNMCAARFGLPTVALRTRGPRGIYERRRARYWNRTSELQAEYIGLALTQFR